MEGRRSLVAGYYTYKYVLITGGSGFIGKVLIEKLLYTCVDIKTIYVVFHRHGGDELLQKQMDELINSPVFNRMRNEGRSNEFKKIVPLVGDIIQPGLGLTEDMRKEITETVSVVFHLAASVKFSEHLRTALDINVTGTRNVLNLCKEIKNLDALCHVSTAYANVNNMVLIEEKVYKPPCTEQEAYDFANKYGPTPIPENDLRQFLGPWPNTYLFTKFLSEIVINGEKGSTPVVLIRPSIVTAAYKEPMPGWVENRKGPTTLLSAVADGAYRVMKGIGSHRADLIPVDTVVNTMIVAAAQCHNEPLLKVFNCVTSTLNPVTWYQVVRGFAKGAVKRKQNRLPFPGLLFTEREWVITWITFLLLVIPCHIMDFFRSLMGKSPKYVKVQALLRETDRVYNYFTSNEWYWSQWRVLHLTEKMQAEDKRDFPIDAKSIDWPQYLDIYSNGAHTYVEKFY